MTKATSEPRKLSQLAPDGNPHHVAALIRSAKDAPEEDLPRLRWRLRASLRHRAIRPRPLLRMVLIASGAFLTGGVVGAMVRPYWQPEPAGRTPTAEPPAKAKRLTVRKRIVRAPDEVNPLVPETAPIEASPLANVAAPLASHRAPVRLARRIAVVSSMPEPMSPAETPAPPAAPSAVAVEQAELSEIVKLLRTKHDPRASLALLDDYSRRFPQTVLAPEVAMLRVEALLALGEKAKALSVLDRLSLAMMPNRDERLVLRGELRAGAGRWREAQADFETPLSDLAFSGIDVKSRDVLERALWGRASARSRLGDEAGARADLASYLRTFPSGRFAGLAAALLEGAR